MISRVRKIEGLFCDGVSSKEFRRTKYNLTYTIQSRVHNIMKKNDLHTRLEYAHYYYSDERHTMFNRNKFMIGHCLLAAVRTDGDRP